MFTCHRPARDQKCYPETTQLRQGGVLNAQVWLPAGSTSGAAPSSLSQTKQPNFIDFIHFFSSYCFCLLLPSFTKCGENCIAWKEVHVKGL